MCVEVRSLKVTSHVSSWFCNLLKSFSISGRSEAADWADQISLVSSGKTVAVLSGPVRWCLTLDIHSVSVDEAWGVPVMTFWSRGLAQFWGTGCCLRFSTLHSLGWLIPVGDQAKNCCVICNPNNGVSGECKKDSRVCAQGGEDGAQYASLWWASSQICGWGQLVPSSIRELVWVQISGDDGFDAEEDQSFKLCNYCCVGNQTIVLQIAGICVLHHWHYDADIRGLRTVARDGDWLKIVVNTSASCLPEALRGLTLRSTMFSENLFVLCGQNSFVQHML